MSRSLVAKAASRRLGELVPAIVGDTVTCVSLAAGGSSLAFWFQALSTHLTWPTLLLFNDQRWRRLQSLL